MSVRMLAVELYRTMRQVEELEKKLKALSSQTAERRELEEELRKTRAEEKRLRAMLEGAKEK